MIVPSMNMSEIIKEIMQDYPMVQRKAFYLTASLRREAVKSKEKHVIRTFDYESKLMNDWIIIADYWLKEPLFTVIATYLDRVGLHGMMVHNDGLSVAHIIPHFLKRYNERYLLKPELSRKQLLDRFLRENALSVHNEYEGKLFVRFREGIGLGYSEYVNNTKIFHYKTYISADMIHAGQLSTTYGCTRQLEEYWKKAYAFTKKTAVV